MFITAEAGFGSFKNISVESGFYEEIKNMNLKQKIEQQISDIKNEYIFDTDYSDKDSGRIAAYKKVIDWMNEEMDIMAKDMEEKETINKEWEYDDRQDKKLEELDADSLENL